MASERIWRRMTLRRADQAVYLDRWGIGTRRWGGVMLHRMDAEDPGIDLHDHPWTFVSIVLVGGYTEERCLVRDAPEHAKLADQSKLQRIHLGLPPMHSVRGEVEHRNRWSVRRLRLDECHRITALDEGKRTWTLCIHGPVRRRWGFYLPTGYMDEKTYDDTVRADRRDLWAEGGYVEKTYIKSDPRAALSDSYSPITKTMAATVADPFSTRHCYGTAHTSHQLACPMHGACSCVIGSPVNDPDCPLHGTNAPW